MSERFGDRLERTPGGCLVWTGYRDPKGYGEVRLPNSDRPVKTHRLAYELVHGPIPAGAMILHGCDNPPCCEPTHLRRGDHAANTRDMLDRSRQAKGYRHGAARLVASDVRQIRARRAAGEQGKLLAREYGVTQATVCDLVKRRTWAWLD